MEKTINLYHNARSEEAVRTAEVLYSLDVMAQEFVPGRTTGLSEFSKFISEIMFRNLNYIAKLIL